MTSPSAPVLHRLILPRPFVPSCRVSPRTPASVAAQPSPSPRRIWRLPLLRSSLPPEGSPAELVAEDSKFVPLNAEDPMYGPPAILLIGFDKSEAVKIQEFLKELDGDFLKVIRCTEEMTKQTLWDAMHTEQPNVEAVKIMKSPQRICIFSGLTGEEMMMFINAYPETGLEQAAFAALVPNSGEKVLAEVIEEIMGDHEMLTGKNSA
ncbi:uncharacterized protein LOC119274624 [Triticum dicoccoides]|uniref:uncharacterized protein LOC119274624 n=1 Tax=Triticum dicoccoides TaxID=85692 RepID=UPI00162D5E94|nr:uncharacterized protein LOC119274624 [Triticum dicoccoides]